MSTSIHFGTTWNKQLRKLLWVGTAVATALLSGCAPTVDDDSEDGCQVGDDSYAPGETFTAPDGCNTCTCGDDGAAACTEMACGDGCDYNGQHYDPGDGFDADDGCNSCFCDVDGSVACTTMACENTCYYDGQVYSVGDEFEPIGGSSCGDMCSCLEDGSVLCDYCAS